MKKTIKINIVITVTSIIIALVAGEVLLRYLGYQSYYQEQGSFFTAYEFDDTLGWVLKKNVSFERDVYYGRDHVNYNLDGLPTDKDNYGKHYDTETSTIALIGDSFVESYYLNYEKSFPYLLDKAIPDKQVINLGVSGYSPDQYLLYSRRHLPNYNVTDIVVVFFPFNDTPLVMKAKYKNYEKPYFEDDNFSQPNNLPLTKLGGYGDDNSSTWQRMIFNLLRKSVLYSLVRESIANKFSGNGIVDLEDKSNYIYDNNTMIKSLNLIKQINLENPQANFFIYYIPEVREIKKVDDYKINLDVYYMYCDYNKLKCNDLSQALKNTNIGVDEIYNQRDNHFTIEGASLIAQHLISILDRNEY